MHKIKRKHKYHKVDRTNDNNQTDKFEEMDIKCKEKNKKKKKNGAIDKILWN